MVSAISIVIPNYNGESLLRANLPSIVAAMEHWGGESELIIVDDCSTDGSCAFIRDAFPMAKLIVNAVNAGFSKTCNVGMAAVRHPVAFCINSDVEVSVDFIAPLLKHFDDADVFAVTPTILAEREGRNQGVVVGLYGKGFLKGGFAPIGETHPVRENMYAVGACVAYRMEMFRTLGGYAEIYSPYLFEDVDLSYRAWKRGWKSLYDPATTVWHYSSATIGKTKKNVKRTVYFRNRFLFHWINLTDGPFLFRHCLHVLLRLAVSFLWLDFTYYKAFYRALQLLGEVRRLRKEVVGHLKIGDAEIVSRTGRAGS
ncbi:glycosyltransferase family 2 protein [Citrifermentans bremense]|uniref:glycosyltransferase family 2 protein n=1 Tax=Citrifermentans bremense TaxID=60035 RepID=UPI000407F374|nr:glycosyltransferase family 2 protein [Citrifermentans bremense]